MRLIRGLGAPALFAVAATAVGSSLYFVLGVVADQALGLTPLVFLAAGIFFVIAMMTYVEGNSLHPERGGASTFARYAFDEFWSFVAGWAILLDYLIVMAIAAFSISHYLEAFWEPAGDAGVELIIGGLAIAYVAWANIRGISAERLRALVSLGLVNLFLTLALVVAGVATVFDLDLILDSIDLGSTPGWEDLIFAATVATVAITGIEAASGFAGEIRVGRRQLRRVVLIGTLATLLLFACVSIVALMLLPVENGATALGSEAYIDAPLLGVASQLDYLTDPFRYAVGAVGAVLLLQAVNGNMLGLSRLAYSLATNRQIPSAVGRLHPEHSTPQVAIVIAALLAFVLLLPDIEFLAGIFAFGAMLTFTIAHAAVIVLRFREPERRRAFRVPLSIRVRGGSIPLPTLLGGLVAAAGWVSVIAYHEGARIVGGIWMVFGVALYVIYRRGQGRPLGKRYTIPAQALQEAPEAEYGSILVPVFGHQIDDDIVGTAGRLAADEGDEGEGGAVIEALYVLEMPMSLPLDARVPEERIAAARQALARAKEVGEEYEGVEVATALVRARSAGAGIVEEAKRRGVEAIVLAAAPPTRIRGGALLGGRGTRERFVDEVAKYVVEKAPCRVILTAAPAGEEGEREGVAP